MGLANWVYVLCFKTWLIECNWNRDTILHYCYFWLRSRIWTQTHKAQNVMNAINWGDLPLVLGVTWNWTKFFGTSFNFENILYVDYKCHPWLKANPWFSSSKLLWEVWETYRFQTSFHHTFAWWSIVGVIIVFFQIYYACS